MKTIEDKILKFATDTDNLVEAVMLLKAGLKQNDDILTCMKRIVGNALLRFHGIPITENDQN